MGWFYDDDDNKRDSDGNFWKKDEAEHDTDDSGLNRIIFGYDKNDYDTCVDDW